MLMNSFFGKNASPQKAYMGTMLIAAALIMLPWIVGQGGNALQL